MNHCLTCKHFIPLAADEVGDAPVTQKAYGSCALAASNDGDPLVGSSLAFAADFEVYRAVLRVHPDFGCVQYQKE